MTQPDFQERLVIKWMKQKAGEDFTCSDFIFQMKNELNVQVIGICFQIEKLYQVLGCSAYDIKNKSSHVQGNVQLDPERTHS